MRWNDPLAYLLTWTTYGTWIHGDSRGSVERGGTQDWPKLVQPDEGLHAHMRAQMKHQPLTLGSEGRTLVEAAIAERCEVKQFKLYALAVRTNHVHLVVSAGDSPSKLLNGFKAWATRRLRDEGWSAKDRPVWTEGGSKRWLWTPDDINRAVDYVGFGQGGELS